MAVEVQLRTHWRWHILQTSLIICFEEEGLLCVFLHI